MSARELIVNADDLGMSPGVNRGILRAHTEGVVTSTSLMVRGTAAAEAAEAVRGHPSLGVGLHLDLAEWEPAADGSWRPLYLVVDASDPVAVSAELDRQLERFKGLIGAPPTHLDSHQHVHRDEPVRSLAQRAAQSLGIPLRHWPPARYCGAFYGEDRHGEAIAGAVEADALRALVEALEGGLTELCCHPAAAVDFPGGYREPRLSELQALCDPSVRAAVDTGGVRLRSFRGVRPWRP